MLTLNEKIPASFLEPEAREIVVNADVKKHWAVMLDMLIAFDALCRKHGISYVADGGTMLGVERHGGFVPWDDDVDLIMKRPEYEKLLEVVHELPEPYFFQDWHTDPMACRGHAQLRNSRTTAILNHEMRGGAPGFTFNQGIFLDVFVMDNVPDDEAEAKSFMRRLARAKERMCGVREACAMRWTACLIPSPERLRRLWLKIRTALYGLLHRESYLSRLCRRFDIAAQAYADVKTRRFANLTFLPDPPPRFIFDATILDEVTRKKFEMLELPVPVRADEYLRQLYGNWHEHVIGTGMHGGMLVDAERPYTDYLPK